MKISARLQITSTADRRDSPRRTLRLGSSLSSTGEDVTIHDISISGMLIETAATLSVFDGLEIELPPAGIMPALVIWNSGRFFGCEFKQHLSQGALSATLLRGQKAKSRDLELPKRPPESPADEQTPEKANAQDADDSATFYSATLPELRRKPPRTKNAFGQLNALLSRKRLRRRVELTEDHILSILIARRGRQAVLGSNLFSEPAWDLLLELYAAKLGSRSMSLADLARAIETPHSTTTRWIAVLKARGLATESDATDPDQQWVRLTDEGASKMKSLIDRWGSAFLST